MHALLCSAHWRLTLNFGSFRSFRSLRHLWVIHCFLLLMLGVLLLLNLACLSGGFFGKIRSGYFEVVHVASLKGTHFGFIVFVFLIELAYFMKAFLRVLWKLNFLIRTDFWKTAIQRTIQWFIELQPAWRGNVIFHSFGFLKFLRLIESLIRIGSSFPWV